MCSPVSRFLEQTGPELGYLVRREAVRRRAWGRGTDPFSHIQASVGMWL